MLPNSEMVPKECGFNQSETACVGIARRFPCSPAMVRDGELIKMQHSCHHIDIIHHPNSSYVTTKLYYMWMQQYDVFRKNYFHFSLPASYAGHVVLAAAVGYNVIGVHRWISIIKFKKST